MNICANINNYVQANGIKKKHLAKEAGMSSNAITLSLSGKRKLTADEYVSICKALKVPLTKFLEKAS